MKLSLMTINIFDDHLGDVINAGSMEKAEKRLNEVLSAAKNAGYEAIDMTYWEAEYFGAENTARIYRNNGLDICSVVYFMEIADEGEIESAFVKAKKAADDINFLGSGVMMVVPLASEKQQALGRNDLRTLILKNIEPLCEYADGIGLKTVIENTPDISTPLGSVIEVKDAFARLPKLGLVYDSANMIVFAEDPYEYLDEFTDRIWHVHLKDIDYAEERSRFSNDTIDGKIMATSPSGKGIIDFERVIDALYEIKYNGYLTVEFMPEKGVELEAQLKRDREYFAAIAENAE